MIYICRGSRDYVVGFTWGNTSGSKQKSQKAGCGFVTFNSASSSVAGLSMFYAALAQSGERRALRSESS